MGTTRDAFRRRREGYVGFVRTCMHVHVGVPILEVLCPHVLCPW